MRWLLNNSHFLAIAAVIAVLAFSVSIQLMRLAKAQRYNEKAVRVCETSPENSKSQLEEAVRLNPENPVYLTNLGLSQLYQVSDTALSCFLERRTMELPDSAVSCFEKAVENSLNESIPLLNLAFTFILRGDEEKALTLLEPLTKQAFCWNPVMICYGMLLERLGRDKEAEEFIAIIVRDNPTVLESGYFSELKVRNPALADAAVQLAVTKARAENYTGNPQSTAKLGELEYLTGDIEQAEALLRTAVDQLPSMNRPWMFLGMIEESKGTKESALHCYEMASQLDMTDALPIYFKARAEGKAYVMAEQMQSLLSYEQRVNLKRSYNSLPVSPILWVKGFEEYCTYDFKREIEQDRYKRNIAVIDSVFSSITSQNSLTVQSLTAYIAQKRLATPCEAGLLDVYPEELRIILYRTDKLRFVESCLALALTVSNMSDHGGKYLSSYDLLSDNVRRLRYRNGVVDKFSDRIFYFSEWAAQAQENGLIEEYTSKFGQEYCQKFSYLSDHLYLLRNAAYYPDAGEDVQAVEQLLEDSNPYYVISPEEMDEKFFENIQSGDIVALVSDRKGEDVCKVGIVCADKLVYASNKEKMVISEDLRSVCKSSLGVRCFRIRTPVL